MWVRFDGMEADLWVRSDRALAVAAVDGGARDLAVLHAGTTCWAVRCTPAEAMQKLDDARAMDEATREGK